jgi:hypothetical protein
MIDPTAALSAPSPLLVLPVARPVAAESKADERLEQECEQNARTWAALLRLGVTAGTELALTFHFTPPCQELAEHLREGGNRVVLEKDCLTGWTPPMALCPAALDDWVAEMLRAGDQHGGCAFAGWTATVG